ncbi:MAG: FAD-binding oxidoreductase [Brucellaceae bacterium]|nr:FAD-binding oxidoreductase [Brucellaceae bacterium]
MNAMADAQLKPDAVSAALAELSALAECAFRGDDATRDYYANDVFWQPGIRPLGVAMPESAETAAHAVGICTNAGIAVVPRGGGMSYSKGYLPAHEHAVVFDMRKLNRVVDVNADDLYITVEAGCTWEQVNAALAPVRRQH